MNRIFGIETCTSYSNSGFNGTFISNPAQCPPPSVLFYLNPVFGILVFEGLLIFSFLWIKQTEYGKRHPIGVSYPSLAFFCWLPSLVLIDFRLSALSGSQEYNFLTGYLPAYICFYLAGAGISLFFFAYAKRFASIVEIKGSLALWPVCAAFVLLWGLGFVNLGLGYALPPFSQYTTVQISIFVISIFPSLYFLFGRAGEYRLMKDALNIAPPLNYCPGCGAALLQNDRRCPSCGLNLFLTSVSANIKSNSPLIALLPVIASLGLLLTNVFHPTSFLFGFALLAIFVLLVVYLGFMATKLSGTTIRFVVNTKTIEEIKNQHIFRYMDSKSREKQIRFENADKIRSKLMIQLKTKRYTRYDIEFYTQKELGTAASMFFSPSKLA